jgi:hypothetical protein
MRTVFRYLLYLGFVVAALIFWPLYFMLALGIFPFPADPACAFEPGGCPPQGLFEHILAIVSIFGAVPATVLLFVFYRRWVHRQIKDETQR